MHLKLVHLKTIIFLSIVLVNCKKDGSKNAVDASLNVDIAYKNTKGQDLLDSTNKNYYSASGKLCFIILSMVKNQK